MQLVLEITGLYHKIMWTIQFLPVCYITLSLSPRQILATTGVGSVTWGNMGKGVMQQTGALGNQYKGFQGTTLHP